MLHSLWKLLFFAWPLSEVALLLAAHTRRASGSVQDRGSIYVLWVVIVGSIWAGSWYAMMHLFGHFAGSGSLRTASLAMLAAGLVIRWTAIVSLGRAFSVNVAIHSDQKLYRQGLFALVRHPSYTGMMLILAALGLRFENWVSLAAVVLLPLLALLYRIKVEEEALAQAFGLEYEAYCSTTRRLIPGVY